MERLLALRRVGLREEGTCHVTDMREAHDIRRDVGIELLETIYV
jgi:hypothetical protein